MTVPARLCTGRLLLREWTAADLAPFAALNADPEVAEHLGEPLDRTSSDALVERIRAGWARHGYGLYAAQARLDGGWGPAGTHLGFIGLGHHRALPAEVEIGWRLARTAWGHGLATEGAMVVRDMALRCLDVPRLISITVPANRRSWRIMQKLGFTLWRSGVPFERWRLQVWELPRERWVGANAPLG